MESVRRRGHFEGGGNSDAPNDDGDIVCHNDTLNVLNNDAIVRNNENACDANDDVVTMIPILLIRCSQARQISPLVPPLGELDDAYVSFLMLPITSKTDI